MNTFINKLLVDVARLEENLNKLNTYNSNDKLNYSSDHEDISFETALLGEKLACKLRRLVYASTNILPATYLNSAASAQGIKINFANDVYELELLTLLPKKRNIHSMEYVTVPLNYALEKYFEENKPPNFNNCVITFNHEYSHELSDKRIRDYDNIELKRMLDIVSLYFLKDDCGQLIDMYNTTSIGEKDCTKIYIMDKKNFINHLGKLLNV